MIIFQESNIHVQHILGKIQKQGKQTNHLILYKNETNYF